MKTKNGFTIVELLIVIVVIAILASISIVAYNGIQARAKSTRNKANATEVVKKAELWNGFIGSYPSYGQLKTNSMSPTQPGGVYTAGGAAGPPESKLSSSITLNYTYPSTDNDIGYIQCGTAAGGYAVYLDPASGNTVNAVPFGSPSPIIYGSGPYCN